MSEVETSESRGRGRPRPTSTIERDAKVLEFIQNSEEPVTRPKIVEGTALQGNEVYLSLWRLKRDGKVKRDGNHWVAVTEAPAA